MGIVYSRYKNSYELCTKMMLNLRCTSQGMLMQYSRVFGIYSTPAPARLFSFRKRKKSELKKGRQAPGSGSHLKSKEELEL